MIANIRTVFNLPTDEVWDTLKKTDTFLYITRGFMGFEGTAEWPSEFRLGLEVNTRILFFNFLPAWRHSLSVVRMDAQALELHSQERGGPIGRWNHLIRLERLPDHRTGYSDTIDIKAGAATIPVWIFAHLFYRYRQFRWKMLIGKFFKHEKRLPG